MKRRTPRSRRATRTRLLLPAAALLTAGCATNPATGGLMLSLVSEGEEIRMGREYSEQVEAQMGLYDDPALQAYVDSIGQAMAALSERPELPWTFEIVDDPAINAFALPGGPVYLARGIMAYFNSEAELASVIGHEIGHITARHSVEQISRARLAQVGLIAGSIASPTVAQFSDAIGGGLGVLFLKFGRDDERQSDMLGFRYMTRAGYDPQGAVDMFQILERQRAESGSSIPEWQSTHPNPGDRVEAARERIAESGTTAGVVDRDEYLRRIEGLVFGPDPRQGYFRGGLFLHPDMEFRLRFPDGWKTQNTTQAVAALAPDEDAVLQLTLAPGSDPAAAAREFFGQQGIRGSVSSRRVNGLDAAGGEFQANTQSGVLVGEGLWIGHGGRIFQLLGYAPSGRARRYADTFRRTLESFAPLTDRAALSVEPKRIEALRVPEPMTVERVYERWPSTIPIEEWLTVNGLHAGDTVPAGRRLKRVVGEGAPSDG